MHKLPLHWWYNWWSDPDSCVFPVCSWWSFSLHTRGGWSWTHMTQAAGTRPQDNFYVTRTLTYSAELVSVMWNISSPLVFQISIFVFSEMYIKMFSFLKSWSWVFETILSPNSINAPNAQSYCICLEFGQLWLWSKCGSSTNQMVVSLISVSPIPCAVVPLGKTLNPKVPLTAMPAVRDWCGIKCCT